MMNRQTKKHHRRHRKAKTNNSLVLVLLISLLCYLATTTCGVVSASLTTDEVAVKYPDCNVSNPHWILEVVVVMEGITTRRHVDGMMETVLLQKATLIVMLIIHLILEMVFVMEEIITSETWPC